MKKVVTDATNVFHTLLQTKHCMTKLAIGDYSYPAYQCLENLYGFASNRVIDPSEFILCFDRGSSWRKQVKDGGYKANRAKKTEKKEYESQLIYGFLNTFIEALGTCFNVVHVNHAEADDGCAVLTKYFALQGYVIDIYSGDIDMSVLTQYPNTRHFRKDWIKYPLHYKTEKVTWDSPQDQIFYQVLRGQPKDGVLAIVNGINDKEKIKFGPVAARQLEKDILSGNMENNKHIKEFIEKHGENWKEVFKENMLRNKKLLDFNFIPDNISKEIIETYENNKACLKPNFERLFQEFNLFQLEHKLFMYQNLFGG